MARYYCQGCGRELTDTVPGLDARYAFGWCSGHGDDPVRKLGATDQQVIETARAAKLQRIRLARARRARLAGQRLTPTERAALEIAGEL